MVVQDRAAKADRAARRYALQAREAKEVSRTVSSRESVASVTMTEQERPHTRTHAEVYRG